MQGYILCRISIILHLLKFVYNIFMFCLQYSLGEFPCVFEKNILLLLGGMLCKCQIRLLDCSIQVFDTLSDFLFVLSITERDLLMSLTIIMDSFTSPFSSTTVCFIYFRVLLLGAYTFRIVFSFWLIDPVIVL